MNSQNVTLFLTSTATLLVGAGIGYLVAEKRLAAYFDERLEKETADLKTFYTAIPGKKYATPAEAVADLVPEAVVEIVQDYQGVEAGRKPQKVPYHLIGKDTKVHEVTRIQGDPVPVAQPVETSNVFEDQRGDIYVISAEEFEANEPDYIQSTLTWYAKDSVLCDERDDRIDDLDATIGAKAVFSFGRVSGDPNTVHVRNLILGLDFEIVRDERAYVEHVLGEEYSPPTERPSGRE